MLKNTIYSIQKLNNILTKKQKQFFVFLLFSALLAALLETISVSAILPLVNAMLTPEKLWEYKWLAPVLRMFSISSNQELIIFVISMVILLYLLKNMYLLFFSWLKAKYSSKVQRECSVFMVESYMNRGYSYFLRKNPNDIVQGAVGDIQGVYSIINSIIYFVTKFLIVLMIGVMMFLTDWIMATGLVCAAFLCLILLIFCFKRPMKRIGERVREYTIAANKILFQAIYGIKEVLVMRKQKEFVDSYKENMFLRQVEDIKRSVSTDAPNYIVEAFCITIIMIVLCFKVISNPSDTAFIAVLATFAVGAFRILPAIGYLSSSFNTIVSCLPSLNVVYENMIEARKYNEEFNCIDATDDEVYKNHKFTTDIRLEDITFSYQQDLDNVLQGLNLTIPKNYSIALVGESGAGKSTLADILLGILPIQKGKILLDNIPIKKIPITWSKLIGFVPQSIYLVDASIAENIAFGVRKEEIDYEQMKKVAKMANVWDFIDSLPEKENTIVGDRGVRLSGGQRQRIGIARALYNNPEILILDEATSALDNTTEQAVMEAIESLQGNITMIVIAHRLTTIKNCDKIYEIVDGQAIERKYEDLV